jgi:hypothetical protein
MTMTAYTYQAQAMMRDYLLADPLVPYTSVLIGVVLCKMVILSLLLIPNLGWIDDRRPLICISDS